MAHELDTENPLSLLDRAADIYELRATEFDSIGEPSLVPMVNVNESRARMLRTLIAQWTSVRKVMCSICQITFKDEPGHTAEEELTSHTRRVHGKEQ